MRQLTIIYSPLHAICGMLRGNAMLILASDKMKQFKVYQWMIGH
jgi:hypothetical protein